MITYEMIKKKRDGGELSGNEISLLIDGYMAGEVPDYQMAAWLMAVFFRGLSLAETISLTDAMVATGDRLDLSVLGRPVMDKHSTGGVGDKVTIVLAPVMAACGAVFGKMSGRGLGHTGGTVDKLESIPGFRTDLSADEYVAQLADIHVCVAGQSGRLVPADDRMYALRDVTATIDSNPLVAASIMSKKIAGGASAVLLDVKVGSGSFFRTRGHASGVAHLIQEIGKARGLPVKALLTSMEQPLGFAVGNSIEVLEAVAALKGGGPVDLIEVVSALAALLLELSDVGWDRDRSLAEARRAIEDGSALNKFREWIRAQGGDDGFVDDPSLLPLAPEVRLVPSADEGFVHSIEALEVGRTALMLGAGRRLKGQSIDHGVGVEIMVKVGDEIGKGRPLARVYARGREAAARAAAQIEKAVLVSSEPSGPIPPLL